MHFRPVKQISTIIRQQYFEPTISWSLRVVLALNVPLIVIPFFKGFSYEVIWSAFGAYMLSLIDYRGLHYKKIIIQAITAVLVVAAALLGMYVGTSVFWSVVAMFFVGGTVALIRNWREYGPSIAVSAGFFFLFGLATPVTFEESIDYCLYLLAGCLWAILITISSFPFQPSNPLRRSVARIWKANTDLLDIMVRKLTLNNEVSLTAVTEKELAVRNLVNQSRNLFASRENKKTRLSTQHYDQMIELRKTGSLFSATCSSMHEALEIINTNVLASVNDASFYKTLSALAQASASVSIVIFTQREADLSLAKVRIKRCEAVAAIFSDNIKNAALSDKEKISVRHFNESLLQALYYLQLSIAQLEKKQNIEKSDYLENYKLSFNEFVSGLKPDALRSQLNALLRINSDQLNYAFRVAIGLTLGVFIFKFFDINHGYWIPLTMMIVIQPYYGATLKKGLERIVGTVAGIVLGGLIMLLPLPRETFITILVVDSFCVAYFLRNNYKVGVFFVTIMMVLLMQISQQGSWQLIGWRILSTLIGALLAVLAGYAFWPVWEKGRFPTLLKNALLRNKKYALQVTDYFRKTLPTGESWHHHRRFAEGANNEAFVSAQRMLEEPEHARLQADRNFALVGSCVRISREITSIGLSIEKSKIFAAAEELDVFYQAITMVFDEVILFVPEGKKGQSPDFNSLKKSLNVPVFQQNDELKFIRLEFEKIVFELEAMCALA
ncbi:MAG: FUSC family protein [Bacteroidota bacterium]